MRYNRSMGGDQTLRAVRADEYDLILRFLTTQRSSLERIEFFYPYQPQELRAVLDGGHFYAVYDADAPIATFGLDLDRTYAEQIADVVRACTHGALAPQRCFELSGLMVDARWRGAGLAGRLADVVLADAAQTLTDADWVCGVVQLDNAASLRTFFSRGFVLGGVYAMGGAYDFGYLVRPVCVSVDCDAPAQWIRARDMRGHARMLADGLVGVQTQEGKIGYAARMAIGYKEKSL